MKFISSLLLLCATSAVSIAQAAAPASAASPIIDLSVPGTPDQLIALEKQKVDYIFGTPEQKQAALRIFSEDFTQIHVGPTGPEWADYSDVLAHMKLFPSMPAGTFALSEFHVSKIAPDCFVVCYKIVGPGPTGAPWTALNSSTWTKRGREWKTVFYQATVTSGS